MIAQKLILSYGSKMIMQLIQITVSIIVARIAGPTVLGTIAFGLAFVSMFVFVADLGISSAHIKLVSEGQDLGKCISTFSVLKIANTSLFFIIPLGIFLLQKYVLGIQFESVAHEYVIIITLIAVTINQLLFIPKTTFAGKMEQAKQDIPDFVRTLFNQLLRVIIVLLGYKAVALAFGNLISTLIIIPFIFYLYKGYPRAKFDKKLAIKYLRISFPVLIIGMSTTVIHYLDKVMLQYFANSEQVGYYTVGYRIGGLIVMVASSVGLLFFPLFSKAASNGDFQYIKNTVEKFERFSFVFIMPAVIFLSLYSDVVIKVLLGSQYLPSIPVMAIINLAMFVMVLNMPYGNVITGMGFFKLAAVLNLFNLFLFITLISILPNSRICNLGANGAAITVLVSCLFVGCLYRIFAHKKCMILNPRKNIKFMVFGILNFIGFYFVYNHLSPFFDFRFKIVFVPLYFSITYLILFLLRWIKKEDFENIKKIMNMKELGRYINGEIRTKSGYDTENKDN